MNFSTPVLLEGVVTNLAFTGWERDICRTGLPVRERLITEDCIPFGGEIFEASLVRPGTLAGELVGSRLTIAYPGHTLARSYRKRTDLLLQRAPEEFSEATGTMYIATAIGNLAESRECLIENGYGNTDNALCPDLSFHSEHFQECLPIAEFLEHYAAGT
ncbi:MAG: hypothetical protein R3F41_04985 [Gammaproteobacteria bacterium]|nr:hypothetical protein [Pseudomonadales bacterium]